MTASRRAGVARRGVRAACAGAVGGRCGWRLTGFEVSVGWIDPSTPSLNLNATGTPVVMDAEMGLSFEVMVIVEEDGWVWCSSRSRADGEVWGVTSGRNRRGSRGATHTP